MSILFTVPHALHPSGQLCFEHRGCDSIAVQVARIFSDIFTAGHYPNEVLIGDINRLSLDLNRIESRFDSQFRQEIRSRFRPNLFVLDLHSFPATETWGTGSTQRCIFLYDGPLSRVASLSSTFPDILILPGKGNDIMDESLEHGLSTILLEVNESESPSFMRDLAERFLRFLKNS